MSDQGKQFESAVFNELLRALDIKRVRTTPYHPQSNGLIERFHATLKAVLRCFISRAKDWEKALPSALLAIRTAINEYGVSPSMMLYGEQICIPGAFSHPTLTYNEAIETQFVDELSNHWFNLRDFVLKNDKTLAKTNVPLPPRFPHPYVWLVQPRLQPSLYPKVRGPYAVQRVDYPVIYIKVDGVEQAVNVDRCKPAHLIQPAKSDNDFLSIRVKDPLWLSATKGGKLKALPNP